MHKYTSTVTFGTKCTEMYQMNTDSFLILQGHLSRRLSLLHRYKIRLRSEGWEGHDKKVYSLVIEPFLSICMYVSGIILWEGPTTAQFLASWHLWLDYKAKVYKHGMMQNAKCSTADKGNEKY